jgi:hypothetical protein
MQPFPYPGPLGAPPPLAALLAPPDPDIGPIVAGDSSIDIDGWALDANRDPTERVAPWWSPIRSIGATAGALFLGGGIGAFVLAMGVGLAASAMGMPQSVLQPMVLAAVGAGIAFGTLLGLRLAHALTFKRQGENVLVGERGVSVTRMRGGALETTTFTYDDDVFWATSATRFIRRGSRALLGDVITNVWVDANGRKLYEARDHVQGTSARTATFTLAMQRRAQVRGPLVRAVLDRGQPLVIPLLQSDPNNMLYGTSSASPGSFLRFEGGALAIELGGVPRARFALPDLRVVVVEGKCIFRSKSRPDAHELRLEEAPDALLLAALFA